MRGSLLRPPKELIEHRLGALYAVLGEPNRLGLADRIVDQALLVQPVHHAPVEGFPGPQGSAERILLANPQQEQRQSGVIDAIGVHGQFGIHGGPPPKSYTWRAHSSDRGRQFHSMVGARST
jgi:hypothetical protein